MNDSNPNAASSGGEYLSFTLGAEHYGVDILKVQEIRGYDSVTRVPDAPDYIKGVINLRGTIVPVIDLRLKLRLDEARYDAFTVMIVLNVDNRVVGIVVDSVSDVIPLSADQIRPPRIRRRRRYPLHLRHRHPGRSHAHPARYRNPARQRRHGPAGRRRRRSCLIRPLRQTGTTFVQQSP